MDLWIKHPRTGEKDTMLTLGVVATVSALAKFLLNGVVAFGIQFGSVDSGLIAAILTPTLGAYVARKYTDKNSADS